MTSTNTFQGLETSSKPSSRVTQPPGGGSSCIFGNSEEVAAPRRQNKMSSNIFNSTPEPDNAPKRSNPPGGKTSGIFQDSAPVQSHVRQNPPGGKTSDIFGEAQMAASPKAHPNKPKDSISLKQEARKNTTPVKADPPAPAASPAVKADPPAPAASPAVKADPPAPVVKADPPAPAPEVKKPVAKEEKVAEKVAVPDPALAAHEPHLGPRPRCHNRVLNPPGGKSSVTFY